MREHVQARSARACRSTSGVKVFHLWDLDLPKTSTRKVKRRDVDQGAAAARARGEGRRRGQAARARRRARRLVAARRARRRLAEEARHDHERDAARRARLRLADVHRARGRARGRRRRRCRIRPSSPALETVADVEKLVARLGAKARSEKPRRDRMRRGEGRRGRSERRRHRRAAAARRRSVAARCAAACARSTSACSRPTSTAARNVPPFGGYIVAANHASHLDTGLVKYALGEQGEALVALAREGLLLRRSGPPDVLRELHEPRADGAPRLAARVAAARRRGDPRRLHPADLPRGHAQRRPA